MGEEKKDMSGVDLIAAERDRQVREERWLPAHDATHVFDELAQAAAQYADPSIRELGPDGVPAGWPWSGEFWKPTPEDRVRELTKAGALIAAEIDRLRRAERQY